MISDKEKRLVAESLRSVAEVARHREGGRGQDLYATWVALSTAITGRIAFCNTSDAFNVLADLIEPERKLTGLRYDEYCVDELETPATRKAYVVSLLDGDKDYKIPIWLYSSREAAERKAREYAEGKHDDLFELAVVNEVEVMDE